MTKKDTVEDMQVSLDLPEMPSGDDLLASLAMEVGIDLGTEEPKVEADETSTKVDIEPISEGTKSDENPTGGTEQKSPGRKSNTKPKATVTKPKSETKPVQKKESTPKDDGKVKEKANGTDNSKPSRRTTKTDKPKSGSKPQKTDKQQSKETKRSVDKKAVFGEWNGFKVNYMGKPMEAEGQFITLPKRYDAKAQEQFRELNGRMVLSVHKNVEGKVTEVKVYQEDTSGKRHELTTDGTMINPNRMENRCRVYAHLLDLAYDRKKDIEEHKAS